MIKIALNLNGCDQKSVSVIQIHSESFRLVRESRNISLRIHFVSCILKDESPVGYDEVHTL